MKRLRAGFIGEVEPLRRLIDDIGEFARAHPGGLRDDNIDIDLPPRLRP
jgi:hypothetical protein